MPDSSPQPESTRELHAGEIDLLAGMIMVMQRRFMPGLMGELSRGKVSFAQFFLLGHLCSQGPMGMSRIAELMDHSTPAATGLVQRLEKLGHISRSHETNDRRKVTVSATPKGARLVDSIRAEMVKNLENLMRLLEPREQRAWLDIYQKITQHSFSRLQ
ncbi:MAG: MarR family transcriptional regulator [Verrucomicrobiota bacterium]|jgi:hypothetical protein